MSDAWTDDATMLQHLGDDDHILGAVVPPIFQNSLFVFKTLDEFEHMATLPPGKHAYSRITNPTVRILEQKVAALERSEEARIFSSGMAAISSAVMSCVKTGDHIVCVETAYGPLKKFLAYLEKFGITHTFVDGREASDIFDQIRPNTSLVYLESPGSIIFRLQDLKAIADHCRRAGISTIVDNTYGLTIQHPIELGIDICVHSASKVISGHSDVVAGALATSKKRIDRIMDAELELFGSIIAPLPAWLMIRGLRTLPMRLSRTRESANKVAEFVAGRPEVEELFHVGHSSFTQPELRDRQMTGSAGLLSFLPKTNDRSKIKAFLESFRIFKMGVSWGGHESLVVPVKMKPMDWPTERYVLRLCVGFESPEDLCSDLERAFPNLA